MRRTSAARRRPGPRAVARRAGAAALRALLLACVLAPACRTSAITPPGSTAFVLGDLEAHVEAALEDVLDAAGEALADLGLRVDSFRADEIDAEIVARSAQEKKIRIQIEALTDETCELTIRVGTSGDEELSRRIYERIQQRLERPS